MVKFLIFILVIVLFPLFQKEDIKVEKSKKVTPLIIENGKFVVFKDKKEGEFKELKYDKNYFVKDLKLKDNNETFIAKSAEFDGKKIVGESVEFMGEYNLKTPYAVYYVKEKIVKGKEFIFNSSEFNLSGSSFEINNSKFIAKNIVLRSSL